MEMRCDLKKKSFLRPRCKIAVKKKKYSKKNIGMSTKPYGQNSSFFTNRWRLPGAIFE